MIEEKLTQEQLARLPVWARRHFDMMERALEAAKAERETLRAALGEAPLEGASGVQSWFMPSRQQIYLLPDKATVRFRFPDANNELRYVEARMEYRTGKAPRLSIRGSGELSTVPHFSNWVTMKVAGHFEDD